MNARYRDERIAGSWLWDASVLRIDTRSRHVRSAIGAPIQEVLLVDQCLDSPSRKVVDAVTLIVVDGARTSIGQGGTFGRGKSQKGGTSIGADTVYTDVNGEK